MLLGHYRFSCTFDSNARLPVYKGSTFRGVFGHALKGVVCALKRQSCPECLLRHQCLYPLVFETGLTMPAPVGTRVSAPPHPFVIEPPQTDQTHFSPGDPFDFSLLLFGAVNQSLPYFIYAMENTGKIGVGARVNGTRGRFSLLSVECDSMPIYSAVEKRLKTEGHLQALCIGNAPGANVRRLKMQMQTPLRVKHDNRLSDHIPFHVLVRAMLRRASTLLSAYGDGPPVLDYGGLVERARKIRTARSTLSWTDWRRYSQRQERSMMMGGVTGAVHYEGDIGEFMPLVEFCQQVHIGKQTAFGLGQFTAEAEP